MTQEEFLTLLDSRPSDPQEAAAWWLSVLAAQDEMREEEERALGIWQE